MRKDEMTRHKQIKWEKLRWDEKRWDKMNWWFCPFPRYQRVLAGSQQLPRRGALHQHRGLVPLPERGQLRDGLRTHWQQPLQRWAELRRPSRRSYSVRVPITGFLKLCDSCVVFTQTSMSVRPESITVAQSLRARTPRALSAVSRRSGAAQVLYRMPSETASVSSC